MKEGVPPVVAARADEVPAGVVIPPDVQVAFCAGCNARVLLSPSSRTLVCAGGAQPACRACAARHLSGAEVLVGGLPPGGAGDLRRWGGIPSFDHEEG